MLTLADDVLRADLLGLLAEGLVRVALGAARALQTDSAGSDAGPGRLAAARSHALGHTETK